MKQCLNFCRITSIEFNEYWYLRNMLYAYHLIGKLFY